MWEQIVIAIAVSFVSGLLMPTPTVKGTNAKAQEQDIPDTEENTGVNVIFGTICVKSPTIATYGDAKTKAIWS